MIGYPCDNCIREQRCTNICEDWSKWFVPEWNDTAERLRKKYGLVLDEAESEESK